MQIKFKKLHKMFKLPKQQTGGSVGFDLQYCGDEEIHLKSAGQMALLATGFAMQMPQGMEAQIRPRSGWALKYGVTVLNAPGTIDSDYTKEVGVMLVKSADWRVNKTTAWAGLPTLDIKPGDRIAQMIISPYPTDLSFVEVDELDESDREGGFGSTGS